LRAEATPGCSAVEDGGDWEWGVLKTVSRCRHRDSEPIEPFAGSAMLS
jgi:hypothetical protein